MKVLFAIILFGFALYFVPLQSTSFYFDDLYSIETNDAIKTIDVPKIFNAFNTRFLPGLSFALNYKFGGLHPQGFRLVNLLIHCLNAFLVYLLLKFMLRARPNGKHEWPAIFGSLLFLCHPLQTEPVSFITQRFVLMAGFFYLLTMVLYIQYRNKAQKKYLLAALASAIAAMFCKEFTVTLPVMLALYEFYFLPDEKLGRRFRRLAPFFLIALIVPLMLLRTPHGVTGVAAIVNPHNITRARGSVSRQEYFLTELNVLRTYVRLMFVPVNQNLDYDYPLSPSLDAKTALSGIFLLGLLALAWLTYRSYRMVSFGILWFFIALSVESSIIPIGDVITEYRPYLASVGFVFVVMSVLYVRQVDVRKLNMIAAVILLGFSILTFQRNLVWKDELSLWQDTVKKSPHKARVLYNLGVAWDEHGNLAQALVDYNKAIALNPRYLEAYNNRGVAYDKQGHLPQAIADYNKSLELRPGNAQAYVNLGVVHSKQGRFAQSIADLDKAIALDPGLYPAYFNRGTAYDRQGDPARAIADYDKTLEIAPGFAGAYLNRGLIYDKQGNEPQAIADFNKTIELDPGSVQAYASRGLAWAKQSQFTQAIADFDKVIKMDPGYMQIYRKEAQAYNDRGVIYAKDHDLSSAVADFTKAIAVDPEFADAYNNRGLAWGRQGDLARALADYNKAIGLNPLFTMAYTNRAISYYQLGKYDLAWADVHEAEDMGATVDPGFIGALKQASGTE